MKRILFFILTLGIIVSLGGCGTENSYPTDDAYHADTDYPYFHFYLYSPILLITGEDGFYLKVANTLLAIDGKTMEVLPLCSKPGCLHNAESDEEKRALCDARTAYSPLNTDLYYQEGNLYLCGQTADQEGEISLTQMKPDGTKRRELFQLPWDGTLTHTCLHRGKLYYAVRGYDENGEGASVLYEKSVSKPHEEARELYRSTDVPKSGNVIYNMIAYGNYLYVDEYIDRERRAVRIYDMRTEEWTQISCPDGLDSIADIWIFNGHLMIGCYQIQPESAAASDGTLEYGVYCCDLNGSNPVRTEIEWGNWISDEEYLYQTEAFSGDRKNDHVYIWNENFEKIDEIRFADLIEEGESLVSVDILPQRGSRQMLLSMDDTGTYKLWYIDREEIGTGHIKPVKFSSFDMGSYS